MFQANNKSGAESKTADQLWHFFNFKKYIISKNINKHADDSTIAMLTVEDETKIHGQIESKTISPINSATFNFKKYII